MAALDIGDGVMYDPFDYTLPPGQPYYTFDKAGNRITSPGSSDCATLRKQRDGIHVMYTSIVMPHDMGGRFPANYYLSLDYRMWYVSSGSGVIANPSTDVLYNEAVAQNGGKLIRDTYLDADTGLEINPPVGITAVLSAPEVQALTQESNRVQGTVAPGAALMDVSGGMSREVTQSAGKPTEAVPDGIVPGIGTGTAQIVPGIGTGTAQGVKTNPITTGQGVEQTARVTNPAITKGVVTVIGLVLLLLIFRN